MFISSVVIDLSPICSPVCRAEYVATTYATIFWESFSDCHANIFRCARYPIEIELPYTMELNLPVLSPISSLGDHCSVIIIIIDIVQRSKTLFLILLSLLVEAITMRDIYVVIRILICIVLLRPCTPSYVEGLDVREGTVSGRSILGEILRPPFSLKLNTPVH